MDFLAQMVAQMGGTDALVQVPNPDCPRANERFEQLKDGNPVEDPDPRPYDGLDDLTLGNESDIFEGHNAFLPGLQALHFKALGIHSHNPADAEDQCRRLIEQSHDRLGEVYNVLGRLADTPEAALHEFRRGKEVGMATIQWNHPLIRQCVAAKDWWDAGELRPIMRAQTLIVSTLVKLRRWQDALDEIQVLEKKMDAGDPKVYSSYVNWRYYYPLILIQLGQHKEALQYMRRNQSGYVKASTSLAWVWNSALCQLKLKMLRGIDTRYWDQESAMPTMAGQESDVAVNVRAVQLNKHVWKYVISHLDPTAQPKELPHKRLPQLLSNPEKEMQADIYWNRHREMWLAHEDELQAMLRIRNRFLINIMFHPDETVDGFAFSSGRIHDRVNLAGAKGSLKVLRKFLALGCDLTPIASSNVIIDLVSVTGVPRMNLVQLLVQLYRHGFSVDLPGEYGLTALNVASYYAQNRGDGGVLIAALMELGVDAWATPPGNQCPAFMAANQGNWLAIKTILERSKPAPTMKQLTSLFYHLISTSCYLCLSGKANGCQRCQHLPHDPDTSFEKGVEVLFAYGVRSRSVLNEHLNSHLLYETGFSMNLVKAHPLVKLLLRLEDEGPEAYLHYTEPSVDLSGLDLTPAVACDFCAATAYKLKRCGRCKKHAYCTRRCQANDWIFHKAECRV